MSSENCYKCVLISKFLMARNFCIDVMHVCEVLKYKTIHHDVVSYPACQKMQTT
jgi:chemotaxis signal transduction protein